MFRDVAREGPYQELRGKQTTSFSGTGERRPAGNEADFFYLNEASIQTQKNKSSFTTFSSSKNSFIAIYDKLFTLIFFSSFQVKIICLYPLLFKHITKPLNALNE